MINRNLTIFERDVIVGALPDILTFNEREDYPFKELTNFFVKHKYNYEKTQRKQKVSFFQSIKNKDSIRYSDKKEEITMIDQRNSSANKSAFFLDQLVKKVMEFDMMKTNQEDL